jgi:hypothetical protein
MLMRAGREMATLLAQACSALVQDFSPLAQIKPATAQAGDGDWNWGKKNLMSDYWCIDTGIDSRRNGIGIGIDQKYRLGYRYF